MSTFDEHPHKPAATLAETQAMWKEKFKEEIARAERRAKLSQMSFDERWSGEMKKFLQISIDFIEKQREG